MFLCYGIFVKILNLWKPSKRNPSQKLLQNTILASVFQSYTLSGISDSVSTDLVRCKQGLSKDVVDAARQVLKAGKAKETAAYFQKQLIDPGFLKSDEKAAAAIVSVLLEIIESDASIPPSMVVDKVSGASKKELLSQRDFILSDFLAGVFLYTVSSVDNRLGKEYVSQIDEEFVFRSPQREIHVLPKPVPPEESESVSLPPQLEDLIRSCNRTLYGAQNSVRVYGSWDELDFDAVYVPPYLNDKPLYDRLDSIASHEPQSALEDDPAPPTEPDETTKPDSPEEPVDTAAKELIEPSSANFLEQTKKILTDSHHFYINGSPYPLANQDVFFKGSKIDWFSFFDLAYGSSKFPDFIITSEKSSTGKTSTLNKLLKRGISPSPDDAPQKEIEHSIPERRERIGSIFEEDDIIYVVGGAGYGKSLFLKNLCVNPGILKGFDERPLLIIRGDIKRLIHPDGHFKTMMEFLEECFAHDSLRRSDEIYPDFLDLCLKAGRCLILLDALDEVGNDQRNELHHLIVSYFEDTYPRNKICITSRERGFIPRRNITCFYIAPITVSDIGEYVDRFIRLKKFGADEKCRFVEQASALVEKEFIKGFLTLSLLLAIYKNEQQLPTNKLQLYQKCFEYMATHREKDKNLIRNSVTGEEYDWTILLRLMSDATFMELARLGAPNNADIPEGKIKEAVLSLYQMKFHSEGECIAAVEMFLQFCADRTEVFIPSPSSNLEYRFFHRSFYEYFYAKSISIHTQTVAETYRELCRFDVDSEVFELLLTIYDQKNPPYLRELVSHAFQQVLARLPAANAQSARAFDILIMILQTVDDRDLIDRLSLLLLEEGDRIGRLPLSVSFSMIGSVIKKGLPFFQENLYDGQKNHLLNIQSWLIRDFLKRESSYQRLLKSKRPARGEEKKPEGFAYSALLSLLPDRCILLDNWFQKFSNAKYLLSVKKLRSHQAEHLASFAKDLICMKSGKRWRIYDDMLLEI